MNEKNVFFNNNFEEEKEIKGDYGKEGHNIDKYSNSDASNNFEENIDVDKFFEEAARDIEANKERDELIEVVGTWIENQKKQAKERFSKIKGLSSYQEEMVDDIFEKISKNFLQEIRFAALNFEEIKKKISQKRKEIKVDEKSEEILTMMKWLEDCSELSLFKLLKRKFLRELSEQDALALNILSIIERGRTLGMHNSLSQEIKLALFNDASFDDYKGTIDHELTHHILNLVVPDATLNRVSSSIKPGNPETKNLAKRMFYGELLLGINESSAYIVEGRIPPFEFYKDKMVPKVFEKVYQTLKDLSTDMTPPERDDFFVRIYAKIASLWRDDMTAEDVSAIIVRLKDYIE